MATTKYAVSAEGKTGTFLPYVSRDGSYPLHSLEKQRATGKGIHHAINKDSTPSFEEAVRRVQAGTHHWHLKCEHSRQYNVFAPESLRIAYIEA